MVSNIEKCRVCGAHELEQLHDFGVVPLADKLQSTADEEVESAELDLMYCPQCSLLQIKQNVAPAVLFKENYPYFSSQIPEVVKHFKEYAKSVESRIAINKDDFILEIASNDGVLLNQFNHLSSNLLGIEPSIDPANEAISKGINTKKEFFNKEYASDLAKEIYQKPKLIFANNVLAHVPEPSSFVEGLALLCNEETTIVIEVPHSLPMIQNNTFDVIFHQHYSYFSLKSLVHLFREANLYVNDVVKVNTQGGSLRLFVSQNDVASSNSVVEILEMERKTGLHGLERYKAFSKEIEKLKNDLLVTLNKLKQNGARIVGYGAPGKAATLLNYFGINNELLDYMVDVSKTKQTKFFPFTNLEIKPVEVLDEDAPGYLLILAWNYSESIMKNLSHLRARGLKFILIYPGVELIH